MPCKTLCSDEATRSTCVSGSVKEGPAHATAPSADDAGYGMQHSVTWGGRKGRRRWGLLFACVLGLVWAWDRSVGSKRGLEG